MKRQMLASLQFITLALGDEAPALLVRLVSRA